MKHTATPFSYNDAEIRRLYDRHRHHDLVDDKSFTTFKSNLIEAIQGPITLIFSILPKAPEISEIFFKHLSDDEFDLVSGLANLIGYMPHSFPIELNPSISPDICLMDHGDIVFATCFDDNNADLLEFTNDIAQFYWDNFDVPDIQALSDEEQLCLLRYMDIPSGDLDTNDKKQHQKLVFGLNIPLELQLFHRARIEELVSRILISPVYAGIFESIFEKDSCEVSGLPYLTGEKDKDIFCRILMQEMAEIWGVPTPIRKDFTDKKEPDNTGKPFVAIMHAYYLSAASKERESGLYYGFNTETGVMQNQDYYDLKALAHEFSHLVSAFMTSGQYNDALFQKEPRLNGSEIPELNHLAPIFEANSPNYGSRRYYPQIGTDFSGLPKPDGKSEYKGQFEERHADWLGVQIADAIKFALQSRQTLRSIHIARAEIADEFTPILKNLNLSQKAPHLEADIYASFHNAQDCEALSEAARAALSSLKNWYKENVDENFERNHLINDSGNKKIRSTTPNLLARQQMRKLAPHIDRLFHLYNTYCSKTGLKKIQDTPPLPLDENELSQSV